MRNLTFKHVGDLQCRLPLSLSYEAIKVIIKNNNKTSLITLTDLSNICKKIFGHNSLAFEDSLFHGDILNVDNSDFSIAIAN